MVNRAVTYNDIGNLEPSRVRIELRAVEPDWRRMVEGMWNPSRQVKGLSLLAGYVAGEAYSIYAVFDAHALTPVTAYLTEQTPFLRAVSGKYREVIDLKGLLPVVLASLLVFALAWCTVRETAWAFTDYGTA
jgi:hypothetical protein